MYIWTGCDINPKFSEFREKVKEISEELNLCRTALNFPQHISLKISFEMDEALAKHCMKDIIELFKATKPFTAKVVGYELRDGIIWLRIEDNEQLKSLHEEIDEIGKSYAVKQHALDKEYIFHSTVVLDGDESKLQAAYEKLKEIPFPEELKINTFLVGHSLDNIEYKVDRRIKVK